MEKPLTETVMEQEVMISLSPSRQSRNMIPVSVRQIAHVRATHHAPVRVIHRVPVILTHHVPVKVIHATIVPACIWLVRITGKS